MRTYTDCHNCGTCDHTDYECPCGCHDLKSMVSATSQGMNEKRLQTLQLRALRNGTPLTQAEHGEVFSEIERLQKQVQDKDQAILLLNELLDKTDTENESLRQQVATLEAARKDAYQEGWYDCEEHQKDRLGDHPWDEHPMWAESKPSMPWTSQEGGDRE